MADLGSYLGQLLSEITIARMQADLESVRIAELYATHPLLRHMPVPHFRLPDVEADVPVVIKQAGGEPAGGPPRGAPSLAEMRKRFDVVLERRLKEEGLGLTARQKTDLKTSLDKATASLGQPKAVAVDVKSVADALAKAAVKTMAGAEGPEKTESRWELEESLKAEARVELINLRKPPARLEVLATTAEIREAGPSEVIARFRLKISEDAFEWTTIELDGEQEDRLVNE